MNCSALQLGLPDWVVNMAQSGNPGGDLRCVADIPTQKYEDLRGLRSDAAARVARLDGKYGPICVVMIGW